MAKHPMGDALDRAEAYVRQRQDAQRLADAAPIMLAALRKVAAACDYDPLTRGMLEPEYADVVAAIAAATGEAA